MNYKENRTFIPSQIILYENICAAKNIADENKILAELRVSNETMHVTFISKRRRDSCFTITEGWN